MKLSRNVLETIRSVAAALEPTAVSDRMQLLPLGVEPVA